MKRLCASIPIFVLVFFLIFQQMSIVAAEIGTYNCYFAYYDSNFSAPSVYGVSNITWATGGGGRSYSCYDGSRYFALYAPNYREADLIPDGRTHYTSSTSGLDTWAAPAHFGTSAPCNYSRGDNEDIEFRNGSTSILQTGYVNFPSPEYFNYGYYTISGSTLTRDGGQSRAYSAGTAIAFSGATNIDNNYYNAYVRTAGLYFYQQNSGSYISLTPSGLHNYTTGGTQLAMYKSTSPYHMILTVKMSNNSLFYSNATYSPSMALSALKPLNVTLSTGFNTFAMASEIVRPSDPERLHLLYLKSDGSLGYRKFESDLWSAETTIASATVSSPALAITASKTVLALYSRAGKVRYRLSSESWATERTLAGDYTDADYISTNKNAQSGKITLTFRGVYLAPPVQPYAPAFSNFYLGLVLASLSSVITVAVAIIVQKNSADITIAVILATAIFIVVFIGVILVSSFESVAPPVV